MTDTAKILSDFADALSYQALPENVVETTKLFIIDYYAACFAGIRLNKEFNNAVKELFCVGNAKPESDFIISKERIGCADAAFVNACYAHGADMDDGNRKAMGHIGASVISAVLSLAQTLDCSGKDIIVSVNVGYEVFNRVGAALQPGLAHRGFHSTGVIGAVAAAAACAKLLGLDADGIYNSMSIASVQASGLLIITASGQCCKPLNPANAARTGIVSAKLASKGVRGPAHPFEDEKGFFHAMSSETGTSVIYNDLGSTFTIMESYIKPYPSCRHTHCGIQCALELRNSVKSFGDIAKITVYIYENAIKIAGQIKKPQNADDTKFSIQYTLAHALVYGSYTLKDVEEFKNDDLLNSVIEKIELVSDNTLENREAGIRGARVCILMKSGKKFEDEVLIPKGDSANPMTVHDVKAKLDSCAHGIIPPDALTRLYKRLLTLETREQINTINLYMDDID